MGDLQQLQSYRCIKYTTSIFYGKGKKVKIVSLYSTSSLIHASNALSSLTRAAGVGRQPPSHRVQPADTG